MLQQQGGNLAALRETACFFLGENLPAVGADPEDSAGTGDQLNFRLRAKRVSQLRLQTGGFGLVVSRGAVFDGDFHDVR